MPTEMTLNEQIQNMLDELPETPANGEHRKNVLTKQDARWLANMMLVIASHHICHIGLNDTQASALKELHASDIRSVKAMVKERRRMLALIGAAFVSVLAWVGTVVLKSTDPIFWGSLLKKMFGVH